MLNLTYSFSLLFAVFFYLERRFSGGNHIVKKPQKTPQSGCPDSNQGLAAYKAVALPSALHPVNGPLHPLAVIFFCLALHYLILGFSNPRYRTNRVTFPLPECKKPPAGCSCRWPITNPGGMTLCTVLRPYTFVIIIITQVKRSERSNIIFLCQFPFQKPACNSQPYAGVPFCVRSGPNSANHPDTCICISSLCGCQECSLCTALPP